MPLLIEMYKRFGCTIYMGVHRTAGICVSVQSTCLPVVHVHRNAGTGVGVHVYLLYICIVLQEQV